MNIVAVMAHPDYLGQCISGTAAAHTRRGDNVYVVAVSPGELGIATVLYPDRPRAECVAIKTQELVEAAKVLDVTKTRVLDFPDSELVNSPELRLAIAGILREFKADILLTHWVNDAHPDLRATGQAALDACLMAALAHIPLSHPAHFVPRAFAFALNTALDFVPDVFVDITETVQLKREAMTRYPTVVAEMKELFANGQERSWSEWLLAPNMFWGQQSGVLYAEVFKEMKPPGLPRRAVQALPFH